MEALSFLPHQNLMGILKHKSSYKSTCSAGISLLEKFLFPASVTPLSQLLQCCTEKVSSKQHYCVSFSRPSTESLFSSLLDAAVLVSLPSEVAWEEHSSPFQSLLLSSLFIWERIKHKHQHLLLTQHQFPGTQTNKSKPPLLMFFLQL